MRSPRAKRPAKRNVTIGGVPVVAKPVRAPAVIQTGVLVPVAEICVASHDVCDANPSVAIDPETRAARLCVICYEASFQEPGYSNNEWDWVLAIRNDPALLIPLMQRPMVGRQRLGDYGAEALKKLGAWAAKKAPDVVRLRERERLEMIAAFAERLAAFELPEVQDGPEWLYEGGDDLDAYLFPNREQEERERRVAAILVRLRTEEAA